MEEDSLEDWISELDQVLNESHEYSFDEQEFLRNILQGPDQDLLPDDVTHKSNNTATCNNSNNYATHLVSFEDNNSIAEPIIRQEPYFPKITGSAAAALEPWSVEKEGSESKAILVPQQKKKVRKIHKKQKHVIAERKRRQELTKSFITLSAIIPGLRKMDKLYLLGETINYTKQLQERVKELEDQIQRRKYSQASSSKSTYNCEVNKKSLFEVEARVLDDLVLIGVHCEKQNNIVFKIHAALLEKLHLSATRSTVLPFGTSTLIITIIAQMMDEECRMSTNDLAKRLGECLSEVCDMQQ